MPNPSPEFSFDIYPGLDAELDAAYARNAGPEAPTPDVPDPDALAKAVQNTLDQTSTTPEVSLSPEVLAWAEDAVSAALLKWHSRQTLDGIPTNLSELSEISPNLTETLEHLFAAKQAIEGSGETNPSGEQLKMDLVLIPWYSFESNLHVLPDFVQAQRNAQGVATSEDYINDDLLNAIRNGDSIYRTAGSPGLRVPVTSYLDLKRNLDGDWGMFLVQTNTDAGVQSLVGKSPNELTADGSQHLKVAGERVDAMGIFEWLALTIQENPAELSSSDFSWMLANRVDVNGGTYVPLGDWGVGQVESGLYDASYSDAIGRPRLAVMHSL